MRRFASATVNLATVACAAVALAACATTAAPTLGPLALGPGEWRVSASPSAALNPRMSALRRAAELTLSQGGDWFRVLSPEGPDARRYRDPDLMTDFASPVDETDRTLSLDIAVGQGRKPAGIDVYDAREVAGHLGGGVPRPVAPGTAA